MKKRVKYVGKADRKAEVIILVHESGVKHSPAFDVLARKSLKRKKPRLYKWLKERSEDYSIDCEIVKDFLKRSKGFEYIFSQDFGHIPIINSSVLATLLEIGRKFRTRVIFAEWAEPKSAWEERLERIKGGFLEV